MRLCALGWCALSLLPVAVGAQSQATAEPGPQLWTELHGERASGASAATDLPSFSKLARALGPAVVNVSTIQGGGEHDPNSLPRPRARGLGTGFFIHRSGYLLTNHHVVENAEQIRVRLSDDREYAAHLVGSDEKTDIALLKIEGPKDLAVAPLGDSDRIQIGEWVMAIGNPLGLDHTVTAGIVSGKGRSDVQPTGPSGGTTNGYYDFLQTDASINAGNSGGPLINARGEVIGINTAINASAQGIAFAIPINMVKTVVPLLRDYGRVRRSWLGLTSQAVSGALRRSFGFPDTRGALVAAVAAGSPAEKAGLLPGDVILEFDGRPVRRADDLQWLSATAGRERKVAIGYRRGETSRSTSAVLGPDPGETPPAAPHTVEKASALGLVVSEISPTFARELGSPELRGVVVVQVEAGSPASEAGLERGDLLLRVGDGEIGRIEDYGKAVRAVARGAMMRFLARREARTFWVAFEKR